MAKSKKEKANAKAKTKGNSNPKSALPNRANRFEVDIESMLVKGEKVIDQAVISNGIYWKAIAVLIISLIVALLVVVEIGALLAVVSILMFVHAAITQQVLMFVLTDRRVFVRYGILQVDVVDIRFSKMESIELERMLPGYLLGYANLVVMGTGNRYIVIPFVANGVELRKLYNNMTLEDKDPQEVVVVDEKKKSDDV